ncbi:hypothetical protein H4219_002471 [Mycoemilia scoparia]|uniref:Uncharacterized protein n=1 Tax=Mycoemilia scoparia TaxID=417184 RepID=A0A9W7ZY99_9FUNG|nr:hypothetical protein H4219_002471 [Mycoemilia scoparia]
MGINIVDLLKLTEGEVTPDTVKTSSFSIDGIGYIKVIYVNLGNWSAAGYALSIGSIVCSIAVIGIVLAHMRTARRFCERPSFRLSASLAFSDILCALYQILLYQFPSIFEHSTERVVRCLHFMMQLGIMSFIFLTLCIVMQLNMVVVLNKPGLARKISPWYELVAWTISIAIASTALYIFKSMKWVAPLKCLAFITSSKQAMTTGLVLVYLPNMIGILICTVTCIVIVMKLWPMWRVNGKSRLRFLRAPEGPHSTEGSHYDDCAETTRLGLHGGLPSMIRQTMYFGPKVTQNLPEQGLGKAAVGTDEGDSHNDHSDGDSGDGWKAKPEPKPFPLEIEKIARMAEGNLHGSTINADIDGSQLEGAEESRISSNSRVRMRQKGVRIAIFRIMLYPAIPAVTQLPLIITLLSSSPHPSLTISAIILPASQGIINFIIFLLNPNFDKMWSRVNRRIRSTFNGWKLRSRARKESASIIPSSPQRPPSTFVTTQELSGGPSDFDQSYHHHHHHQRNYSTDHDVAMGHPQDFQPHYVSNNNEKSTQVHHNISGLTANGTASTISDNITSTSSPQSNCDGYEDSAKQSSSTIGINGHVLSKLNKQTSSTNLISQPPNTKPR